jgi:hypothetical protein
MADTTEPTPIEPKAVDASIAPAPIEPSEPALSPTPAVPSNLAVGLVAGIGFGLLAAIVYAVITIVSDREFLVLGLLIGFAIAFGFHRFGHTRGVLPGVLAAVIAAVVYVIAIFLETAGGLTKVYDVGFLDALRTCIQYPTDVFSSYFSDGLSYVFFVVSVGMAFYYAWGGRQRA